MQLLLELVRGLKKLVSGFRQLTNETRSSEKQPAYNGLTQLVSVFLGLVSELGRLLRGLRQLVSGFGQLVSVLTSFVSGLLTKLQM